MKLIQWKEEFQFIIIMTALLLMSDKDMLTLYFDVKCGTWRIMRGRECLKLEIWETQTRSEIPILFFFLQLLYLIAFYK